jgi:hypothetical protein
MTQQESDLPIELAAPARRALVGAGSLRLEQLTKLSEAEVKQQTSSETISAHFLLSGSRAERLLS